MYNDRILKALAGTGAEIGDRIRIRRLADNVDFIGLLLPKTAWSDPDCIVIKLKSGYNAGVRFSEGTTVIELVEKGKPITPGAVISKDSEGKSLPDAGTLPSVSILGMGGTIASGVEYRTGAVFPIFKPEDLIRTVPALGKLARIDGEQVTNIFSEDVTPYHWKLMAERIAEKIGEGEDGVICTHGTDTMHYTSAALSFMLQNLPVPVIVVGAQRSSDRGSSDNVVNLVCATLAALDEAAVVGVCMHAGTSDEACYLHPGTKVRKMHTSRRDTFRSINAKPFSYINYYSHTITHLRDDYLRRDAGRKLRLDTDFNPRVGLIKFHPYMNPEFVAGLSKYYDGIVLEGTGLGHASANVTDEHCRPIIRELQGLINSGVHVVMTSQTIYGRLNMNVYSTGRDLQDAGVLCGEDMLPETAFVKLMWVLGHARDAATVKKMMVGTTYAGEISERTDPETFLA